MGNEQENPELVEARKLVEALQSSTVSYLVKTHLADESDRKAAEVLRSHLQFFLGEVPQDVEKSLTEYSDLENAKLLGKRIQNIRTLIELSKFDGVSTLRSTNQLSGFCETSKRTLEKLRGNLKNFEKEARDHGRPHVLDSCDKECVEADGILKSLEAGLNEWLEAEAITKSVILWRLHSSEELGLMHKLAELSALRSKQLMKRDWDALVGTWIENATIQLSDTRTKWNNLESRAKQAYQLFDDAVQNVKESRDAANTEIKGVVEALKTAIGEASKLDRVSRMVIAQKRYSCSSKRWLGAACVLIGVIIYVASTFGPTCLPAESSNYSDFQITSYWASRAAILGALVTSLTVTIFNYKRASRLAISYQSRLDEINSFAALQKSGVLEGNLGSLISLHLLTRPIDSGIGSEDGNQADAVLDLLSKKIKDG